MKQPGNRPKAPSRLPHLLASILAGCLLYLLASRIMEDRLIADITLTAAAFIALLLFIHDRKDQEDLEE